MGTLSWRAVGKCRVLMNGENSATTTTTSSAKKKPFINWFIIRQSMPVSPELQEFLGGANEASRMIALQKVWEHIKLHNLQNPTNKREIICDQKLKTLFSGKDTVGFLEITRLLSQHFVKTA